MIETRKSLVKFEKATGRKLIASVPVLAEPVAAKAAIERGEARESTPQKTGDEVASDSRGVGGKLTAQQKWKRGNREHLRLYMRDYREAKKHRRSSALLARRLMRVAIKRVERARAECDPDENASNLTYQFNELMRVEKEKRRREFMLGKAQNEMLRAKK